MQLKTAFLGLLLLPILGCGEYSIVMDVQGHRGARGHFPENAMAGFEEAIKMGANTLEMDVVISGDGQVLVSHEPWLNAEICMDPLGNPILPANERAFNLYKMPYDSIRLCDCGSLGNADFPQQKKQVAVKPLLSEVFGITANLPTLNQAPVRYNIELKREKEHDRIFYPPVEDFAQKVLDVVDAADLLGRVTLQSFDIEMMQELNQRNSGYDLALLVDEGEDYKEKLSELGFYPAIISPWQKLVDEAFMKFAAEKNMKVIPWTVNTEADMKHLIALRVDGIITDYPDRLSKVLEVDLEGAE